MVKDYAADLNGDGVFDGEVAKTPDHRHGCSGIDDVAFGPQFGRTDGPRLLTVASGIYANAARADNDHQVLLQYDIADWASHERPLTESAPHHSGPAAVHGKYFVRTGNTTYGVQNLACDEVQQRWFLGVYKGTKSSFPNYLLVAIDARTPPRTGDLIGVPGAGGQGAERGQLLALAADGLNGSSHRHPRLEPESRRRSPSRSAAGFSISRKTPARAVRRPAISRRCAGRVTRRSRSCPHAC